MKKQESVPARRHTAIDGAMALIIILLIVQIWLLMATLETYLAGHQETILPAAIISGAIFLACFGLYLFIERMDAEYRSAAGPQAKPTTETRRGGATTKTLTAEDAKSAKERREEASRE